MKQLTLADRIISTERPALIMGIVNATPDSFWKESRGGSEHALRLADEGADIIDIGGESTRPGAEYTGEEEELSRVIPVIEAVRKKSSVPISVDTRKYSVMKAAYEAGADILNDISALEDDPRLGEFAAGKKIPVILMHKRGIPVIMQKETSYADAFKEVDSYLRGRIEFASGCGISSDKIIIDPGIGFGKNTESNKVLIARCGQLCGGKYPVLMALSRKTVIGDITGQAAEGRLAGTLAANIVSVISGASILRVHDVRETADALAVIGALEYAYKNKEVKSERI